MDLAQAWSEIWGATLANPAQALTAVAAIGSLLAGLASVVAAHGSQAAARVMRQDLLLRQRPYVFVDRTIVNILESPNGRSLRTFAFLRNSGAIPAKVQVRLTYSLGNEVLVDTSFKHLTLYANQERQSPEWASDNEFLGKIKSQPIGEKTTFVRKIHCDYAPFGYRSDLTTWPYFSTITSRLNIDTADSPEFIVEEADGN